MNTANAMNAKKIFGILGFLILLGLLMYGIVISQDGTPDDFTGNGVYVEQERVIPLNQDTVHVPVMAQGLDVIPNGVISYNIRMSFPTQYLFLSNILTAGTLSDNMTVYYNTDSTQANAVIRVAAATAQAIPTSGELFTLVFDVKAGASSGLIIPINFDNVIFNDGSVAVDSRNGSIRLEQLVVGDVDNNNIVEAFDAALVLQYTVGITGTAFVEDEFMIFRADVNADANINAFDAARILQYNAGIITEFTRTL